MSLEHNDKPSDPDVVGAAIGLIDKISSLKDGGFRITIDMPNSEIGMISELVKIKAQPETQLFYITFIKKDQDFIG